MYAGLYCYEQACFEAGDCDLSALLDDATDEAVGKGATCDWTDDTTVTITFGTGAHLKRKQRLGLVEHIPNALYVPHLCPPASNCIRLSHSDFGESRSVCRTTVFSQAV